MVGGLALPSRRSTYLLLVGSMVAILAAGLAIPEVAGHPVGARAGAALFVTPPALPPGGPADHDSRPPPAHAVASMVTGVPVPPNVALTASDVGVTPTAITLGVILPGLGALTSFGISVSELDPKVQQTYWQSAVARVNATGGVAGRKLQLRFVTASVISTDSQRAACRALTEDHPVFAVANDLGITGDPVLCVTRDHRTPYLGVDGEDPSAYRISQGRLVTLEASTTRTLQFFVQRLTTLDLVKGHRFGIVYPTGAGGVDGPALARELRARGAKSVVDGPLGSQDALVITGQVTAAEQHMHQAGVDTVILMTNAVYGTVFGSQADQDKYHPSYLVTDLSFATAGDSFVGNMPPSFFRQALAVTTTDIGRGRAGLPESTLERGCRLAYQAFIHHPAPRDGTDAVASLGSCALVQLLTMGLNGAGPNPTRASFTAALGNVGAFAVPGVGRGVLTAGRLDAADVVEVALGHADCQCWYTVDGYRSVAPG